MTVPLIIVVVIVVVGGMAMLSRTGSQRKKEAIADLQREKEALQIPGILDLVNDEVREAGIAELPGAEGLDPVVLLKVWKRDREACGEGEGRFVVSDGVEASAAKEANVVFECVAE
ncbi:MAG: hypothetical protein MUQ27_03075 [Acidimicrobiia bacterium]|nr:hypothetical protein [Acidimicrobiia bacterium]